MGCLPRSWKVGTPKFLKMGLAVGQTGTGQTSLQKSSLWPRLSLFPLPALVRARVPGCPLDEVDRSSVFQLLRGRSFQAAVQSSTTGVGLNTQGNSFVSHDVSCEKAAGRQSPSRGECRARGPGPSVAPWPRRPGRTEADPDPRSAWCRRFPQGMLTLCRTISM